jgi:hypothetical protein
MRKKRGKEEEIRAPLGKVCFATDVNVGFQLNNWR